MANKSKRTPECERRILQAIQEGTPVKQAAAVAGGVNPSTLYRWRVTDPEFDMAIQRARALFLHRQIMRIEEAGSRDWRAAAFLLERSEPADWGKRVEVAVEIEGQPVTDLLTGQVLRESIEDSAKPKQLGSGED